MYRGVRWSRKTKPLLCTQVYAQNMFYPPNRYFHKENKSQLPTKKDYYHLLRDRTGRSMHPRLLPSASVTLSVRSKRVEPDSDMQPKTVTQVIFNFGLSCP